MKRCSVQGCERRYRCSGYCAVHYERVRHHGSPELPPRPTPEQRFWAKVAKSDGCWNWTGAEMGKGYGHLSVDGRLVPAHRFSFEIHNGQIPPGLFVDHVCHNKRCVKPDHLRVASPKQNQENLVGLKRNNTSGFRGVTRSPSRQRWFAEVTHHGVKHRAGTYGTAEEAGEAAAQLRARLFTHDDDAKRLSKRQPQTRTDKEGATR